MILGKETFKTVAELDSHSNILGRRGGNHGPRCVSRSFLIPGTNNVSNQNFTGELLCSICHQDWNIWCWAADRIVTIVAVASTSVVAVAGARVVAVAGAIVAVASTSVVAVAGAIVAVASTSVVAVTRAVGFTP
jgi:hypothetical protein